MVVPRPKDAVETTPSRTTRGLAKFPPRHIPKLAPAPVDGPWLPLSSFFSSVREGLARLRLAASAVLTPSTAWPSFSAITPRPRPERSFSKTCAFKPFCPADAELLGDLDDLAQVLAPFPSAQVQPLAQAITVGSAVANPRRWRGTAPTPSGSCWPIRALQAREFPPRAPVTIGSRPITIRTIHGSSPHGPDGEDVSTLGAMLNRSDARFPSGSIRCSHRHRGSATQSRPGRTTPQACAHCRAGLDARVEVTVQQVKLTPEGQKRPALRPPVEDSCYEVELAFLLLQPASLPTSIVTNRQRDSLYSPRD